MKRGVLLSLLVLATVARAYAAPSVREAVTRSLPILQSSAGEFVAKRACFSCHHNALPILTLRLARGRGFTIDVKTLDAVEEKTLRPLRGPNALDDAVQATNLSDPTPNESLLLIAAHAAGMPPDLTTAVYATRMMAWQRDGHWITSDFRPPHSSSIFTSTATAIRAIGFYAPPELTAERDAAISAARRWLVKTKPESTEDAAFRLMGLAWAAAGKAELAGAITDLLALQKSNGGWSQLPDYESDAYSTGEALFALHEAGIAASDPTFAKGIGFLVSTQAHDGSWHVRTRMLSPAEVSPMYFPTGFPYGKDEFLSYAGTCWAVMALLSALPDPHPALRADLSQGERDDRPLRAERSDGGPSPSGRGRPEGPGEGSAPPTWARTALFGSPAQLAALLDQGLDPNSKTPNGATILMMASHDAQKVRTLLARGATANLRSQNGTDALAIASTYRGSSGSLAALLEAGAEVDAPAGVRTRHSPLVFATMTGDLDNVRLLLARGAKPSVEALSEAVTFDYPDIVQILIRAGADASIKEGSGINLLHWAAIANRSDVIPVLAAAHAPLDATDDSGFTPLMYAATLDHGDTKTIQALLKAGADRRIRNQDGRTPADQARRLKHARLADALK